MACSICLDKRKNDVFKTGRVAICRSCIQLLNETDISPSRACEIIDAYLRRRLHAWDDLKRTRPEAYEPWLVKYAIQRYEDPVAFENYFSGNRAKWVNELAGGGYKEWLSAEQMVALKVIRAFRRRLLRKDPRRNFDYPADWKIRSAKVRRQDNEACRLCGKTWDPGALDLHVHHIIQKANGGSHNPNNLVTLCHHHHNDEHPDQVFTAVAVEPESLRPVAPQPSLEPEPVSAEEPEGVEAKDCGSRAPADHEVSKSFQVTQKSDDDMLVDGVTIAGAYIEEGVRDFEAYAEAMTKDLGESARPYLLKFYEGARQYPGLDVTGMSSVEDAAKRHAVMMHPEPVSILDVETWIVGANPVNSHQSDETCSASQSQDHRRDKKAWNPLLFVAICVAFLLLICFL